MLRCLELGGLADWDGCDSCSWSWPLRSWGSSARLPCNLGCFLEAACSIVPCSVSLVVHALMGSHVGESMRRDRDSEGACLPRKG